LYLQLAQFDAAVQCFRRALSLDSTNANARNDLGVALLKLGLIAEAETEFRAVVDANPAHAAAWSSLGDVLQLRGLLDEAEKCFRAALALSPMDGNVLNNLATVARRRRQFDVAQAYCDHVLGGNPRHIGALNNVGSLAAAQGDYVRAETVYRVAQRLDPRHSSTRFNLATTLLTRGAYEEGFELYESRFDAFPASYRHVNPFLKSRRSLRRWRGEYRPSDRLLIWGEQGLGDFVMMSRYIPYAFNRTSSVTVLCDPALRRLAECVAPGTRVITSFQDAEGYEFDSQCPVMSLPSAFATRIDSIPARHSYLSLPEEALTPWNQRIVGAKPKVGIAWAGSKTLEEDQRRSIPFDQLAPLLAEDHVEWVSLQKGDHAQDWPAGRSDSGCIEDCQDLFDTAALITNLDLVISVDTVIAHLAGALGRPVWLLNRYSTDWRWGVSWEDSPWYQSMRIFRQQYQDDWRPVVTRTLSEFRSLELKRFERPGC
jgi:Flp pilus assembly protein TadD